MPRPNERIAGPPRQDLLVALDDADGRILYARFFPQEGTASSFAALESCPANNLHYPEVILSVSEGSRGCRLCGRDGLLF